MLVDEIARDIGGRGEAEVIAPALETGDAVVLIDERAARAYAVARGLQVRGTLGIVLHAKQEGPIELATPLLDELGTVASGSMMQRIEGHASWHLHLRTAKALAEAAALAPERPRPGQGLASQPAPYLASSAAALQPVDYTEVRDSEDRFLSAHPPCYGLVMREDLSDLDATAQAALIRRGDLDRAR
jgi:hypothetical protein